MKPANHASRLTARTLAVSAVCLAAFGLLLAASTQPSAAVRPNADNQYIGAKKCKNCHKSEEVGNQFGAWEKAAHSRAFEALASDEAKAIAKERGIEDPQKADECVKCHTTAHGVDKKLIKKGFKAEMGVQCETCHGPGGLHMKARFAAAAAEEENPTVEPGEVIMPTKETCLECHNSESPTFEKFCFFEMVTKIRHPRPGNEGPTEFECSCPNDCDCTEACPGHEIFGAGK